MSSQAPTDAAPASGIHSRRSPRLHVIANLWSLQGHPDPDREWSLERKVEAVQEAGFAGFTWRLDPEQARLAERHQLITVGFFAAADARAFRTLIARNADAGARRINVHLGSDATSDDEAIALALQLRAEAERAGVPCDVETHRGTCTETPEKTYRLAAAYFKETGHRLPLTWDFSHFAIVKHLSAPYWPQLLVDASLVQHARQLHFRPFNGHHCQVPVTAGSGQWTPEFVEWLPVLEHTLETWLAGEHEGPTDLFTCPEMGPVAGGYNLSSMGNSWQDVVTLGAVIAQTWGKLVAGRDKGTQIR